LRAPQPFPHRRDAQLPILNNQIEHVPPQPSPTPPASQPV
jgi:hypothetical protein